LTAIVAVADGDRLVTRGLAVHREAIRRADLVVAGVAAPDRVLLVVARVHARSEELAGDALGDLRHAVALHERQDADLVRREPRVQPEHGPLALALGVRRLLCIRIAEDREHAARRT